MNILDVFAIDNFVLCVTSDDGAVGLVDIRPFLHSEAFAPLKDGDQSQRVQSGGYFVEWECGADLSADTIEAQWTPATPQMAQRLAQNRRSASHGP